MDPLSFLACLTAGITGLGVLESLHHKHKLKKIRHRIHVSGTRGKTSLTRLICAGLNNNGIRTAAKTTGTLPRMIIPDGREVPVFRPVGANIMEQMRIISTASDLGVEALVLECMALQPELHWISEDKFIKATHGVITNIRPDHLDVMGPTTKDVALAISGMIPVKGKLYTAERVNREILKNACDDRGTELIAVSKEEVDSVTDEELAGFSYTEHRDNVALAIKFLEDFRIPRKNAVEAMWKVLPDPGVLTEHRLNFFGRKIIFVNAFAANDPESTGMIWDMMRKKYSGVENFVVVFNLREDRPLRTLQFVNETEFWKNADKVVLMGSGSYLFSRIASTKTDYPVSRFVYTEQDSVEEIFEKIIDISGSSALIVGVGNIGGLGIPLTRYFKNRENLDTKRISNELTETNAV